MAYFKNFPIIKYKFGNNEESVFYKDASVYVDLIDQVADNVSFYTSFNILDGERPDTLSYKLYGTSDYYWTFFLLNEKLRESGWPLSHRKVYEFVEEVYPNYAIQLDGAGSLNTGGIVKNYLASDTVLAQTFPVGGNVLLNDNSANVANAKIVSKNLDIGQMILRFVSGDVTVMTNINEITYSDGVNIFSAGASYGTNFFNNVVEYNSPAYYTNSLEARVDIDPYDIATSTGPLIPITYQEKLISYNDDLKIIKILKQDAISNIVSEFNRLVKG
jgi:hypothetical protein